MKQMVHIDAAHRGVGTASCGPDTLDKYIIKTGVHTWAGLDIAKRRPFPAAFVTSNQRTAA